MAAKSIIDVEVKDEAFKKFFDLFQQYKAEAGTLGATWEEIGGATEGAFAGFAEGTAALLLQRELVRTQNQEWRKQEKEQERLNKLLEQRKGLMKTMLSDTVGVAKGIAGITMDLFKWASIGTVVSGLVGMGGLFGMDALGRNASGTLRTARGYGVDPGQLQAARLAFSPYLNADNALGAVTQAGTDLTMQKPLITMGINRGASRTDQLEELFVKTTQLMQRTPEAMLQQIAQARGLDQVFSPAELETMHRLSKQELIDHQKLYEQEKKELVLAPEVAKRWQTMDIALQGAKLQIENALLKGLAPLADKLPDLTKAIVKVIDTFAAQGGFEKLAKDLAEGVSWVAKELNDPKLRAGVAEFARDLPILADRLVDLLKKLGWIPKTPAEKQNAARGRLLGDLALTAINPLFGFDVLANIGPAMGGKMPKFSSFAPKELQFLPLAVQGVIDYESRHFDPNASNNIGGGHRGYVQYGQARRKEIIKGLGIDPWTASGPEQGEILKWALVNTPAGQRTMRALANARTAEEQARAFSHYFETPGQPYEDTEVRSAVRWASRQSGGAMAVHVTVNTPPGMSATATARAMATPG